MQLTAFRCWRTCQRRTWNPASCTRWDEIWAVAICFIWKEENSWCLSSQPFICLFSLFFDFLINVICLGWKINWVSLFDGWQAGFNVKDESAAAFTSKTQSVLWHILTGGHFRWIILQSYVTVNNSQCTKRAGLGSDHSHALECFCTQMGTLAMFYLKKQLPWYWMKFTHSISMSSPADCVLVLKLLHGCCFGMATFDLVLSSCVDWSSVFRNWTEQNVLLHLCFITAGKIRNTTTKKEKAPRRTKADVSQKKIAHPDGVGTGCTNRPLGRRRVLSNAHSGALQRGCCAAVRPTHSSLCAALIHLPSPVTIETQQRRMLRAGAGRQKC